MYKRQGGAQSLFLRGDRFEMIGVDFGNDHRHVGGKAVRGIIGHHGDFALGIRFLQSFDFFLIHIHRAKDEIDGFRNFIDVVFGVEYRQSRVFFGNGAAESPFARHGLRIGLSRGAAGRRKRRDFEQGVILQEMCIRDRY